MIDKLHPLDGSSRKPTPNAGRNQNLDLLRAAAISMVLIYHGVQMSPTPIRWLTPITSYGQYGVDLFFVLSGWLIGGLYWRERSSFGDVLITNFWVRRWIRTIPPYLAAFLLSWLAVHYARRQPFDYGYLVFAQNYYTKVPFFLVSWSLCVEEHFYLVIPVIFVFWHHRQGKKMYLWAALATIAPAGFRFFEYPRLGPEFGFPITATHLKMEGLLLGFFLSYFSTCAPRDFAVIQRAAPCVLFSSLALMILLRFAGAPWLQYTLWETTLSFFLSAVLVCSVSCMEIQIGNRFIALIAITSYSTYLTHALAIEIARGISMKASEAQVLLYFPIMLATVVLFSMLFFSL